MLFYLQLEHWGAGVLLWQDDLGDLALKDLTPLRAKY